MYIYEYRHTHAPAKKAHKYVRACKRKDRPSGSPRQAHTAARVVVVVVVVRACKVKDRPSGRQPEVQQCVVVVCVCSLSLV